MTLRTCPKGHKTAFPRSCPICQALRHPWNPERMEAGIRRHAKKTARKALERLKPC